MFAVSSPAEHIDLLEQSLAAAVPEWPLWQSATMGDWWHAEVESPAVPGRRLEVVLREDGDVDVCVHWDPSARGPEEAHFPVEEGRAPDTYRAVATLVADLAAERLVVAFRRGWFRGGREFLRPSELTPERRRTLSWIVSWRGTHDWRARR